MERREELNDAADTFVRDADGSSLGRLSVRKKDEPLGFGREI